MSRSPYRRSFIAGLGAAAGVAVVGTPAAAQPTRRDPLATTVDAVQMPAWVDRGGRRLPIAAGDVVTTNDEVNTGAGAALVLRLSEGSLVRLGEKTRLAVPWQHARERDGRVELRAELKLLDGFFRFATSVVAKALGERQIEVGVRTATIGIRGTDFWTMTDEVHDAACLFEGRVDLNTRDQGALTLDRPTAFWARFFQQPVQPVGNATPQQLATFLSSTEMQPGRGIALAGGAWRVIAFSGRDSRAAMRTGSRLREAGYPARLVSRSGEHQVHIDQLASRADAEAVLGRMQSQFDVQGRVEPAR